MACFCLCLASVVFLSSCSSGGTALLNARLTYASTVSGSDDSSEKVSVAQPDGRDAPRAAASKSTGSGLAQSSSAKGTAKSSRNGSSSSGSQPASSSSELQPGSSSSMPQDSRPSSSSPKKPSDSSSSVPSADVDPVKAVNSAVEKLLKQNYICFNFTNTTEENGTSTSSGNVQLSTCDDTFLTKFYEAAADGTTCCYHSGGTIYFQRGSGDNLFIKKATYSHSDYSHYVCLLMEEIKKDEIRSCRSSISGQNSGKAEFVLDGPAGYSAVSEILGYSSGSLSVSSVTVSFVLESGTITGCSQWITASHDGKSCKLTMQKDFYAVSSGFSIIKPKFIA